MSTTRAVSKSSAAHSPYQRLFMLPGAKAFCLSGAVARLPISMMSLGIVLASTISTTIGPSPAP